MKRFAAKVSDLQRTLKASQRVTLGGRKNHLLRQDIQSGAVLIGFAHFEAYYREIVEDIFVALSAAGVSADALSSSVRSHCALAWTLKDWMGVADPGKLQQRIWDYRQSGGLNPLLDGSRVSNDYGKQVLSGITYPKLDNVKKLLSRLGFDEPLTELRRLAKKKVDEYLISYHDARVDLAHNGNPPGWAASDYQEKLRELVYFSGILDRVLFKWHCKVAGSGSWPA